MYNSFGYVICFRLPGEESAMTKQEVLDKYRIKGDYIPSEIEII